MKTETPTLSTTPSASHVPTLQGFDRVVVPTDFSAPSMKALHYARTLAGGTVELVHVIRPIYAYDATAATLGYDARKAAVDELEAIAARFRQRAPQINTCVREGDDAAGEVARFASEWDAELIVLSTHARTGVAHLAMGSVADKLVRHATCPILVLRKHEHDFVIGSSAHDPELRLQRILVPTDFTTRSREALHFAIYFARRFGGSVTLLHALHVPGSGALGDIPGVDMAPLTTAAEQGARAAMNQALEHLPAPGVAREMIVPGVPLDVITRTAVDGKFDLIVCATNSSAVLRHTLLGSTAEAIVRHACCPVLIVLSCACRSSST